ncbi:MAG: urea ABC transporter permease subunit UrtB [Deferribacteres bacterium]|nr:urea ABC transporter permease subunit UrtB [Deferribacteres bacterium]
MLKRGVLYRTGIILLLQAIWLFCALSARADDAVVRADILRLAHDDPAVRREAVMALAKTGDQRLEDFLESYRMGSIYIWKGRPVLCERTIMDEEMNELAPLSDPLTRRPLMNNGRQVVVPVAELTGISPTRRERRLAGRAKFLLRLSSPDAAMRLSGAKKAGDPPGIVEAVELLRELSENDPDRKVRYTARESLLLLRLNERTAGPEAEDRLAVVRELGEMKSMRALPRLRELLREITGKDHGAEGFAARPLRTARGLVRSHGAPAADSAEQVYRRAIRQIEIHQGFVDYFGSIFQGFSLGSILILMALGLAITFGLMGVINMAHGELMMIGAYTTFEIQRLAGHTPDNPSDWYYMLALPAAFLSSALVGYLIEVLVVRHLYRRPVESLLATWGVGLILIQLVRLRYGDNIGVNAPSWARGGIEVMQDIVLPYGRCFIIVLCAFCVLLIYYLMKRTGLGLRMRATMQNRDMAASLGVNTGRVDRYTFAFGSGIAGIAGYAWTLIGGVTPDMGQTNFIVDSFLVVVTGGVGELLGVIFSGLGIGVLTKVLEPATIGSFTVGAIWAKVLLLLVIVTFIQFKPAGLFAPRGRLADE